MQATASRSRRSPSFGWAVRTASIWLLAIAGAAEFWFYLNGGRHGLDSHAYWLTGHRTDLYGPPPGSPDAYLYSPAFADLIRPLTWPSWSVFKNVWMLVEAAGFAWLLAPLGLRWGGPAFLLCTVEISVGNIYPFMAAALVLGLRYPAVWAFPLLTKLTPCLGPIWFAARQEWRAVAISAAASAGVILASLAFGTREWSEWLHFVTSHSSESQALLPARVAVAVLLTVIAARTDRRWLLAPAMLAANPMVHHALMSLTLLAAVPRLRASDRQPAARLRTEPTPSALAPTGH